MNRPIDQAAFDRAVIEVDVLADPQAPDFRALSARVGPEEANRILQLHYKAYPAPRLAEGAKVTGVCWSGLQ